MNSKKHSRGFVYDELIKWAAIGAIVLLGGWGLFKYQSGLYEKISTLEANEATLKKSLGEKDSEIKFLKDLKVSDAETIKKLKERKAEVVEKIKLVYVAKDTKIGTINNDPTLTPEQKSQLKSEVQIDSVWWAYCEFADNPEDICPRLDPPGTPALNDVVNFQTETQDE